MHVPGGVQGVHRRQQLGGDDGGLRRRELGHLEEPAQ